MSYIPQILIYRPDLEARAEKLTDLRYAVLRKNASLKTKQEQIIAGELLDALETGNTCVLKSIPILSITPVYTSKNSAVRQFLVDFDIAYTTLN